MRGAARQLTPPPSCPPTCLPMHATKLQVVLRPRLRPTLVKPMSRKRGALNLMSVGWEVGSLRVRVGDVLMCVCDQEVWQRGMATSAAMLDVFAQGVACTRHAAGPGRGVPSQSLVTRSPTRLQPLAHRATMNPWPLALPTSAAVLVKL